MHYYSALAPCYCGVPSCTNIRLHFIYVGNISCPRDQLIFTCTVIGSGALYWGSKEYIGSGGVQLEFSTADGVGERINSSVNPDTFAILTNVTNGSTSGTTVLQSKLYILSNQSSAVSCLTVDHGSRQSINFTVLRESMSDLVFHKPSSIIRVHG